MFTYTYMYNCTEFSSALYIMFSLSSSHTRIHTHAHAHTCTRTHIQTYCHSVGDVVFTHMSKCSLSGCLCNRSRGVPAVRATPSTLITFLVGGVADNSDITPPAHYACIDLL